MPKSEQMEISKLSLDLLNFRTVRQQGEEHAVHALISISPDRFWAVMESILDDGYHPTENIIVQEAGKNSLIVKEGNRRIASLKMASGLISYTDIPQNIKDKIKSLDDDWKKTNNAIPCIVYSSDESDEVKKIVSLTHGKGEKAAREVWTSVARARYDREENGVPTPGLDLLEAYLIKGRNLSPQQAERWAGDYPLTVLDEAISKIAPILGFSSKKRHGFFLPPKEQKSIRSNSVRYRNLSTWFQGNKGQKKLLWD